MITLVIYKYRVTSDGITVHWISVKLIFLKWVLRRTKSVIGNEILFLFWFFVSVSIQSKNWWFCDGKILEQLKHIEHVFAADIGLIWCLYLIFSNRFSCTITVLHVAFIIGKLKKQFLWNIKKNNFSMTDILIAA